MRKISSTDDLFGMLESRAPGDMVKLRLQRPSTDVDSDVPATEITCDSAPVTEDARD